MKRLAQTTAMVIGLAALPLAAQTSTPPPATGAHDGATATDSMARHTDVDNDNDFNMGWLGLLGLAGLVGLRRHRHTHVDARDPMTHSGPSTRADRY